MVAALAWGALAASSLVLGAALAFARGWSRRQIGLVLAFGAGALISAGALLVMLIDSMIPDARADAGHAAGLVTVLGFALAAGLSNLA